MPFLNTEMIASAPNEEELLDQLPEPLVAPTFHIEEWDPENEPLGITRLCSGETFLDGVRRIASRMGNIQGKKDASC